MKKSHFKVCKKCGIEKPITEFHKQATGKLGVKAVCKECYNRHYREKHPPKERNITREWSISAIACLLRHCICKGCLMEDLESHCRMKKEVIKLVAEYGTPIQYREPTIREDNI